LESGKEVRQFKGHKADVFCAAFSPDGKYMASGSSDGTIRLWDVQTGKELRRFEGHLETYNQRQLLISPDFLKSLQNPSIRVPDIGNEDVLSIVFSPDGRKLLSGSGDWTVRLWDVATGKELRRFEGHKERVVRVAFAAGGRHVLSASSDHKAGTGEPFDNSIRLWDAETGKELRRFESSRDDVFGVAFSPDGRRALVATGKYEGGERGYIDNVIRLWDVETGKEIHRFEGHVHEVLAVAFSADGKYAVSGSSDYTTRLWRLPGPGTKPTAKPPAKLPAAPQQAAKAWEIVTVGTGFIAVPKGWRDGGPATARMLLFRQGDGIGVPVLDETGAPLQVGMTVEKFPQTKGSLKEGIEGLLKRAKNDQRLELVGKEVVETLKLSDGTEAMLLTAEFIKDKDRKSLQMKMLVKDGESNGWVISAYLVGDKDSKLPVASSYLGQWLRVHVTSFCFDKTKLDESKLKEISTLR
jgi:hypothetical protein